MHRVPPSLPPQCCQCHSATLASRCTQIHAVPKHQHLPDPNSLNFTSYPASLRAVTQYGIAGRGRDQDLEPRNSAPAMRTCHLTLRCKDMAADKSVGNTHVTGFSRDYLCYQCCDRPFCMHLTTRASICSWHYKPLLFPLPIVLLSPCLAP